MTYINEIVSVLEKHNIKVKLFADDVKMYVRILDDLDVMSLQLALDALFQWSDAWQLPMSINKCCVLNIVKVTYNTDAHIRPNGCILPIVTHTRDLGVIVSSDLSPSVHITDIVSKAHQRAGLILRTFTYRDIKIRL